MKDRIHRLAEKHLGLHELKQRVDREAIPQDQEIVLFDSAILGFDSDQARIQRVRDQIREELDTRRIE